MQTEVLITEMENVDTGAETLSDLPDPTEILRGKAGPGTQVCMTRLRHVCHQATATAVSQASGSQDLKRKGQGQLHPGTGMKFQGAEEMRKKEGSRAAGQQGESEAGCHGSDPQQEPIRIQVLKLSPVTQA